MSGLRLRIQAFDGCRLQGMDMTVGWLLGAWRGGLSLPCRIVWIGGWGCGELWLSCCVRGICIDVMRFVVVLLILLVRLLSVVGIETQVGIICLGCPIVLL
jgi:hypothetical protein